MSAVCPFHRIEFESMCVHRCYAERVGRIGVRELRNQTAAAVRRAGSGERIVVTVDGRPVAQLGPLDPGPGQRTLDDLAAAGLVLLPRRRDRPEPEAAVAVWPGFRMDRLLREVRGR
jgi:prevent-host-death family protein